MTPMRDTLNHELCGKCIWDLFMVPTLSWHTRDEVWKYLSDQMAARDRVFDSVVRSASVTLQLRRGL